MKVSAIVAAAGSGKRLGGATPKPLVRVSGKPILVHTLLNLKRSFPFHEIIAAVDPSLAPEIREVLRNHALSGVRVVKGGKTRAESVWNALAETSLDCDWVLVHDAARPLVSAPLVRRLLKAALRPGAAILAVPVTSTVKRVDVRTKTILGTIDRSSVYLAQTPQVFKRKWLLERYPRLGRKALRLTDEASFFEGTRTRVKVVPGDLRNLKITTPEDIKLCEFYMKRRKCA